MAAIFLRFIIKYFYIFEHLVGVTFVKLGRNTYLDTFFIKYCYQPIEFSKWPPFFKKIILFVVEKK